VILLAATAAGLLAFSWLRWRKQRTSAGLPPLTAVGGRCSTEATTTMKESSFRKSASSTLVS
jgi:hypothetical protein